MKVLLTRIASGEADTIHSEAVAALKAEMPDLRWVSSYRVHGSVDFVDVVHLDEEEAAAANRILTAVPGCETEILAAEPSEMLRAPGGAPGAPPG